MEIKQLEYVIMAADMGSFNKASEYLYTTQSNVSKVIRSLESELGYEIFNRQGSGVVLTHAGRALYEQSQQILQMLKKFETFSDLKQKSCFHVAIVVSNFIARQFAQFAKKHEEENLCLKIYEESISGIIDLVGNEEAEIGFVYLGIRQNRAFQSLMHKKGLYFQTLIPAKMIICAGIQNPYANRESVSFEELRTMKFVRYMEDSLSRTYHLAQVEREFHLEENMADAIEVGSDYALVDILTNTNRVYLFYGGIGVKKDRFSRDIREVLVEYEGEDIYLGYIHKNELPLSPFASEFLNQIRQSYHIQD